MNHTLFAARIPAATERVAATVNLLSTYYRTTAPQLFNAIYAQRKKSFQQKKHANNTCIYYTNRSKNAVAIATQTLVRILGGADIFDRVKK